ncbi:WXG100 family type VII secretion target [Streptomyces auratus AGR0001]|uniref:WXG100 family type VII secretion target n=2 Tax=Streptomyces auratus TaxID=114687 RepID=A0A8B1NRL9_9ACTN|nr:WXG100 family type VII secretion target [Streptomyces auratus AGR0001]
MAGSRDEFSVHPEDMKSVAPTFSRESANLGKALNALKHSLSGLGAPWGDDEQGKKFGHSYTPKRDEIFKAIGVLVKGLDSIHDGLNAHAENHAHADHHTASTFKR